MPKVQAAMGERWQRVGDKEEKGGERGRGKQRSVDTAHNPLERAFPFLAGIHGLQEYMRHQGLLHYKI